MLGFEPILMKASVLVAVTHVTTSLSETIFINDVLLVGWVGWERWVSSV
jgi:hypothetical protein